VIADLTGNNANVFYELGVAHTVRCAESVLLTTQSMEAVPFDVRHNRCNEYTSDPGGLRQLQAKIVEFMKTQVLPTRFLFRLAPGQRYESEKVLGKDLSLYSFSNSNVILARNAAQFLLKVFRHSYNRPPEPVDPDPQPVALQVGERISMPMIPYGLKLDEANPARAVCCVCRPESRAA
jgi:hypothetical protein